MNLPTRFALGTCGLLIGAAMTLSGAQTAEPIVLTIFAAGTLAVPFKEVSAIFEKQNPNVTVHAQFGGSVMMAKKITDLHQDADLLAVADYNVIPKYMFGNSPHAAWYAGFARNAITFVYTDKSKSPARSTRRTGTKCWGARASRSAVPIQTPIRPATRPYRCSV